MSNEFQNVKAISFDLYQTLIDMDSCRNLVVCEIFNDGLPSTHTIDDIWQLSSQHLGKLLLSEGCKNTPDGFVDAKTLFQKAYEQAFLEMGLDACPMRSAAILSHYHGSKSLFADVESTLTHLSNRFPIYLTTDADEDFLSVALTNLPSCFTAVLSSEATRCYKINPNGTIWMQLLDHTKCKADEVVHIGDGLSDVAGAKRWGLKSVWLNRHNREWTYDKVKPDAIISTLTELEDLL